MIKKTLLVIAYILATAALAMAQDAPGDTARQAGNSRPGLLRRIGNYISDTSTDTTRRVRWFVLGGPHFSTDAKLGLALSGMASFHLSGCSHSEQPSNLIAWGDVTTAGFWSTGLAGTLLFPHDRMRVNTELRFSYSPWYFWGIGYDNGNNDDNKTQLHQREVRFSGDVAWQVATKFYIGPALAWNYIHTDEPDHPWLLEGQDRTLRNLGVGFALHYDSRDLMTNATRGTYLSLKQLFRPGFLGNDYAFSTTEVAASAYHTVWRGGVLAGEVRGTFNFGSPSWAMLALLGSNSRMRGYYKGRFRDKHSLETQVELRQHLWKRSGMTLWAGVGSVFHNGHTLHQLLPNYGIGYRFEVRKNMNLRLDYGFGKRGHSGFVMSMYEAF